MISFIQRRRITVRGIVQGVGFRPFVYTHARLRGLSGFVGNNAEGVFIEVEGPQRNIEAFLTELCQQPPPLAMIESITSENLATSGESGFAIVESEVSVVVRDTLISPDSTVCGSCLEEFFDPRDRRFLYPFINCTNCGPRFTITMDVPYDRTNTTMRSFPLCRKCKAEYEDPINRRFHAQPNACPRCGPQVSLLEWSGRRTTEEDEDDAVRRAADALTGDAIIAVKGLGGYHLCCDALSDAAVAKLRRRKAREAKPFAVMVPNVHAARVFCEVSEAEAALLLSVQRPIVLLRRRTDCEISSALAPGVDTLGVMLPYTPLHYLLFDRYRDAAGDDRPVALVMTSANASDDPIVYRDDEALDKLKTVADGALVHDRTIHMRCDDSVVQVSGEGLMFLRRSRGYAPTPIALAAPVPAPILAVGAHLKNTFSLVKANQVFVSHHIGDLQSADTHTSFGSTIEHYQRLFGIVPEVVAHDLHPQYQSTRYAEQSGIPIKVAVQHHEAHIASVMAEHLITEPVIGIAADGTGYGWDGTIWGGEFLIGDCRGFERFAHLETVPMPGGEQAVRQPWRLGAVYLSKAFGKEFMELDLAFCRAIDLSKWNIFERMIEREVQSPLTSSIGRLFDAIAAIIGLRSEVLYEGQAAVELETQGRRFAGGDPPPAVAERAGVAAYPVVFPKAGGPIDVTPLVRALVRNVEVGMAVPEVAFRFHVSLAQVMLDGCLAARRQTSLRKVILGGGVFQNCLLLELLVPRLRSSGFDVLVNRLVPPNDGGISLGQIAIAAARLNA